jgi:diguanylate cyclase (GGDEF)-like protein/PAS domain S-box-containing protein
MHLIERLRQSSIRFRLVVLAAFNGAMALLLVGTIVLGYLKFDLRRTAVRELLIQAGIVADNASGALGLSNEHAAAQLLTPLRRDPQLLRAVVFDASDRIFASYTRASSADSGVFGTLRFRNGINNAYFKDGSLFVCQPVMRGTKRLGAVCLEEGMGDVDARLHAYTVIVCLVLLGTLSLASLSGSRMQRAITAPLVLLSRVAATVSENEDYSVRVPGNAMGDVGRLIDSFNKMLKQIEIHENARNDAEHSLRESEERFALAARGANDGLWDWRRSTGLIYLSPRGNEMLGYPEMEKWLTWEDWVSLIHPSDRPQVIEDWTLRIRDSRVEFISEFRMLHRDASSIWVLSRGRSVKDSAGQVVRVAGSLTDITEDKAADRLTGLRSRFYFIDRLEDAIHDTAASGSPFAVLFLDLDRFKLVNDSLGHAAGDNLLMEIATRLRLSLGGSAPAPVMARLGGDEFAVLARNTTQPEAVEIANRMLSYIAAPFRLGSQQIFPGVSIGVAMNSSAAAAEDLLRNADTAMYTAKKAGRGRVEVFDARMRDRVRARLEIETELRAAINNGELVVHYQPQMLLPERRISGFEALVRWQHPQRGLTPPGEFISIAEETGLIVPLGRWVLHEAASQMALWQKRFGLAKWFTISVNVSYQQLREPGFVDDVKQALAETGLDGRSLRLEMTESTIIANADETSATLDRLKELNVGLEIDDFGTGYSSLSCLNRLPFDTVKIDRTFIRDLDNKAEVAGIVRAILELARSMSMSVIAEGVETSGQLDELGTLGCSHAQGFFFSRPISAQDAAVLIEKQAIHGAFHQLACQSEQEIQPGQSGRRRTCAEPAPV